MTVDNPLGDTAARPGSDKPSISTARYERKKQAIVAAATEILNRDGVKGMTLANVASSVGLITTSVTYYFKKKEELAVACFLDSIVRIEALTAGALTLTDPHARLRRLLELWFDLQGRIRRREVPAIAAFNDMRALQKEQRAVVFDAYRRFFGNVQRLFVAPELAYLDDRSQMARAHVLTEQMFWSAGWLSHYDIEDFARIRDRMIEIYEHGLALPSSRWAPASLPLDAVLPAVAAEDAAAETFLIAATRLINERGYRGASVEKISARLNVTKGSFYHHNEAKDDLVVECFKRSFETLRRVQRAAIDSPGDQWWQLTTVAATLVDYQLSERGPLLRTSALSALPATMRNEMVSGSDRISDRFAAMISDGIAAGVIRAVDPFVAARMLTATLNVYATINRWFPGVGRDEAIALYAKPMMMGIFSR